MVDEDHLILRISIFVLIFCTNLLTASEKCQEDDVLSNYLYVIRSKGPSGLVLDATESDQVKLQHFTGSDSQLWRFQPTSRPSAYYIVNEHHGKVLDFVERDDGYFHLVVNDKQKCMQQYWNFSIKGQIVNAGNNRNVDVKGEDFRAGNIVIVWWGHECLCQEFLLQKKT